MGVGGREGLVEGLEDGNGAGEKDGETLGSMHKPQLLIHISLEVL